MDFGILSALQTLLPMFLIWLIIKVAPDFVGKVLLKPFDYASDARIAKVKDDLNRQSTLTIERVKAEMQATYSTLSTSVDILSAGQSGMRGEIIDATKLLWREMVSLRSKLGSIVTFYEVFTPDEISDALSGRKNAQILKWVAVTESEDNLSKLLLDVLRQEIDGARLFCGDRLWTLFYTNRAIYARLAWLTSKSFKDKHCVDWRSDKGIPTLLFSVLLEELREKIVTEPQGLSIALGAIENQFIHEAFRVMSGSKAVAESLSDVQSVMQFEQQRATLETLRKEENK